MAQITCLAHVALTEEIVDIELKVYRSCWSAVYIFSLYSYLEILFVFRTR